MTETETDPYKITAHDLETVERFNQLYQRVPNRTWMSTTWRGVQVAKPPTDLWLYQELIFKNPPDLIVETGTFAGGSARFFADLLDMVGFGEVVTIDTTAMGWARKASHPRITFLVGSSLDPGIFQRVKEVASKARKVMVVLDSLHTAEHVLAEMRLYGKLVSPGCYLVVEDTVSIGYPRQAIEAYLKEDSRFTVDTGCDKFFLSFSTGGFLRRDS